MKNEPPLQILLPLLNVTFFWSIPASSAGQAQKVTKEKSPADANQPELWERISRKK